MTTRNSVVIGIVSDTHIPDRVSNLHPDLLPSLKNAGVDKILLAGDISTQKVIAALQNVAPVTAVRGNRDWLFKDELPLIQNMEINGVKLSLLHGHINFLSYLKDKAIHMTRGYELNRYLPRLINACPDAQVIIFGHTHHPEILWIENRLIFNPGSCSITTKKAPVPHFGLIRIDPSGKIDAELVELTGYQIDHRNWKKEEKNG